VVWIDRVIEVAPVWRDDARIMLLLLICVLCLDVATTPLRVGLYVRMRFVELNLIQLLTEFLRVAILLSLLFGVSTRALWMVVATAAGGIANILILLVYTRRILPEARFRAGLISRTTIRQLLGFSLWTLVQGLNNLVLRAAPALLLNRHASPVDVASFQVGNLADMQIRKLVVAAVAPATPALTTIYATEGEAALQKFYYIGGRYYLWAALFLIPPLLVFAYPLIELYVGARYGEAATVMVLILGAYPFTWASGMFYQIAYAVGRIRAFNIYSLFLGVVALAAMWYFVVVREMGAIGAAAGLGGGYAVVHLLIMWPFGLRLVQGRWRDFLTRTLLPGLGPFAAALAACYLYGRLVPIDSWAAFIGGCATSAAIYVMVLGGACLKPEDKTLLRRAWRRIARRRGNGPPP
jgi:O-antigen/teichoic acid export membrane protein